MTGPTHNPWGRPLSEGGRGIAPDDRFEQAFRECGLGESDARSAARGLAKGRFRNFEDAAASVLMWSRRPSRVSPAKVAEVAARLAGRAPVAVEDPQGQALVEGVARIEELQAEVTDLAVSRLGFDEKQARKYAEESRYLQVVEGWGALERLTRRRDELQALPKGKS